MREAATDPQIDFQVDAIPHRPFHRTADSSLAIDGVALATLAERFGTPLYVYSSAQIRQRLALFQGAFAAVPHLVCYAVKANSALAILQLLGEAGAGFDIVSGGELERVRRACPQALRRVVFSGVGKQAWEVDAALGADILLFNVESAGEIDLLAARARALGVRARFALRVNPDVRAETHPYISTGLREHKFGVDLAEARALYRYAAGHGSLLATGVSVHIGSQIRSVAPFAEALARVATLVRALRADGHSITYIDAGGGLGIDYMAPFSSDDAPHARQELTGCGEGLVKDVAAIEDVAVQQALSPDAEVMDYARGVLPAIAELGCTLVLEPGRFLVAPAGGLLTRVLGEKRNGAKRFVITDAAMNDLIRPALYQAHHEIVVVNGARGDEEGRGAQGAAGIAAADVVGPVCESGDFFAHDRVLPPMHTGDLLLLADAGAYGMSQSSNYNTRVRPAEVLIEDGAARLIRRRETIDDLLAPELLL